ncbi:hypothetical protein NG798_18090 [Ancylothrix sp. C2]|uniref:hypothetical protein n=1 Tax=Ancylothrix sp. D3o TaxID=2953691 RepID=UPI0021BB29BA|nr:hypothetical protein [Ancylothrix sp. D3o]MCT7951717.1 hypothetical protein [Ancylothrix sp. D3o]
MFNSPLHPESSTELDLLESLLLSDNAYPWNPAEPHCQEYFTDREDEFILDDWPVDELTSRSQAFYKKLENLWSKVEPKSALLQPLQTSLKQHFALTLPPDWLSVIATGTVSLLDSPLSLAEKLVKCLHPLLPNFAEEDLQVLARPVAYAMRGHDSLDTPQKPWSDLSDIEKARLGLAVVRFALDQVEDTSGR